MSFPVSVMQRSRIKPQHNQEMSVKNKTPGTLLRQTALLPSVNY